MRARVTMIAAACGAMAATASCLAGGVVNDVCFGALPLFEGPNAISIPEATLGGPTVNLVCPGVDGSFDVWFTFTAPREGTVTFSTCNSVSFDSAIALYSGTCLALSPLACEAATDGCNLGSAAVSQKVAEGDVLFVRLLGETPAASGAGFLNVQLDPPLPDCPASAHSCTTTGSPGCSNIDCCQLVCAFDPFCCIDSWDGICAIEAILLCGGLGCAQSNHGCFVQGGRGCTDSSCCEQVCDLDPSCCSTAWDAECVQGAAIVCAPQSCAFADHDCLTTGAPGCSDLECCSDVCQLDAFCCLDSWDTLCTLTAVESCDGAPLACGTATHGCLTTGTPGCSDPICCEAVCSQDGYCCLVEWDSLCVADATLACVGFPLPANDRCALATHLGIGSHVFFTGNATSSPTPEVPAECDPLDAIFPPTFANDIWFTIEPEGAGTLIITLCGQTDFDAQMQIFRSPGESLPTDCSEWIPEVCIDNDPNCPGLNGFAALTEDGDDRYRLIRIGGANPAQPGGLGILTIVFGQPDNDTCVNAIPLDEGDPELIVNFGGAQAESSSLQTLCGSVPGLPYLGGEGFNDVWYSYRAVCDGTVKIDINGLDGDPIVCAGPEIKVYDAVGGCNPLPAALPTIDSCSDSSLTFEALCDQDYLIRVGGVGIGCPLESGGATLQVTCLAKPCPSTLCVADLDGDGFVTGADLGLLLSVWGTAAADLDEDGITSGSDLGLLLSSWGACP